MTGRWKPQPICGIEKQKSTVGWKTRGGWLSRAFDFSEFAGGATAWLAVTGLSRSGKTVLITSLVHNLLSALHNPNRMALLRVAGEGRLIAAQIEGAKASRLPRFPYRDN